MRQFNKKVIIFDGACNLCSSAISFVRKRDRNRKFTFLPFQTEKLKEYLGNKENAIPPDKSVILINNTIEL